MKPWLVCAILIQAGCASTSGTGWHWYAPSSWGSHRPAAAVDRANQAETAAGKAAIKQAQKSTHETEVALGFAANSRPVVAARESTGVAAGLLAQAASPLTAAEAEAARRTVTGLLSDDPATRSAAEAERATENRTIADISSRLAKAQAASDAAEKNLRAAFERENQLANELRSAHALHWILGGCALLALIGWIYVRFVLGGIPTAVGMALSSLEAKNPTAANEFRDVLDKAANRHEQTTLRAAYLRSK